MLKFLLFSVLFVGILIASNAETNKPAVVNVTINTNAAVIISENFMDDVHLLRGDNYHVSIKNSVRGAIISSDGYIVASSKDLDNESVAKLVLADAKESIIRDAGNTLHINKYLENASEEQLANYRKKVSENIGGEDKLADVFTKAYQDGKINISITVETLEVEYLGGQKKYGNITNVSNGTLLIKIDDDNLPVVSFVNDQTNNNLVIQTPQGNSQTFISNSMGETIALISGDKTIDAKIVAQVIKENSIQKKEPNYKKNYEDALTLHKQGNNSEALDKFKTVLELQPNHSYAREYVNDIESKLNEDQAKSAIFDKAYSLGRSVKNRLPDKILVAFPYVMTILLMILFTAIGSRITGRTKYKKIKPSIQR